MKKYWQAVGIACLFFAMWFSGCTETQDVSGDTDKVEITSYAIVTEAYSQDTEWEEYGDGFTPELLPEIVTVIIPDLYTYTGARYRILGTMKNIAGYTLESVRISAKFYDMNNTYLDEEYSSRIQLEKEQSKEFIITCPSSNDYFYEVDHVSFSISVL